MPKILILKHVFYFSKVELNVKQKNAKFLFLRRNHSSPRFVILAEIY
jgi:hypothetical protein